MDFTLSADQQAVVDAVGTILARQAGADRARALGPAGHDDALLDAFDNGGFLDVWRDDTVGALGAVLLAQAASRHHARANLAVRVVVAPALLDGELPRRVAVTSRASRGPVRYGQFADTVLILDGDEAVVAAVAASRAVDSPYGFPYAYVDTTGERRLGPGSGARLEAWWRVAVAAEISGALDGAVAHTAAYLSDRRQFGRPLGGLQALQHRLAEAHVWAEGTRWLTRRAAFDGASPATAAAAAAYATQAAQLIGADTHQLSGAIGFTTEFDLHLWTTRLHGLRVELGGTTAHQVATAVATWG